MLVLGAQVLLGFQPRSAFQEAFDALPAPSRTMDAIALMLMLLVVGLLITPAIHHRVVDDGDATARTQVLVGRVMTAALIPFALSLAINIFIVVERTAGLGVAVLAAVGTAGAALWFWFGTELLALKRKGGKPMATRDEPLPLGQKIDQMLTEARVILPGRKRCSAFSLPWR